MLQQKIVSLEEYLKPETTQLLDEIFDGVYIIDLNRRILFWNKGAEKITGYSSKMMSNVLCHEGPLQHHDQLDCRLCENKCPATHAMESNQEIVEVIYAKKASGAYVPVETHIHPLVDKTNRVIGALEVFRDVTAWKQIEQLSVEKDRLVGVLAHDLRNPLTVILSYGKLLLSHADTKVRVMAEPIVRKALFANNLVDTLLDAKAVESGKIEIHYENVDLVNSLKPIIAGFMPLAEKKQIALVFSNSTASSQAWTDPLRLEEIVNNLVSNAIKYSQPNTTIQISLVPRPEGIGLVIQDQGLGMSPVDLANLFDAFHKGKNQPTAGEGSHGLGLYIVKKLVDLLGAQIQVESQVGKGTAFTVVFPTSSPAKPPAHRSAS